MSYPIKVRLCPTYICLFICIYDAVYLSGRRFMRSYDNALLTVHVPSPSTYMYDAFYDKNLWHHKGKFLPM